MAATINDRDNSFDSPRVLFTGTRGVKVTSSSAIFSFNNSGVSTPTSVTFTATQNGISGTVNWSVVSGTATLGSSTGATTTLAATDMATRTAVIRATVTIAGVSYTDDISISKVQDGSNGTNGTNGSNGSNGSSARIAYVRVANGFVPSSSSSNTVSGDSLPTDGYWGTQISSWTYTTQSISTGESLFQTNGTYNPVTNQTTWVSPYLSNLKVGTLSALTIYTGTLEVDSTGYVRGGQTAYNTGTGFWIGYNGGTYKFSIGSSTQSLTWDGSALTMTGKLQIGTAGLSGGAMTGAGAQINTDGTFALGTSTITTGSGGNGYDAVGGHILYNGTEMVLNGIVKTSGLKGVSFKAAGSVSGNTGNLTRIAGTESMLQVSRYAGTSLPAVYVYDDSSTTTQALYVTNTTNFAGSSMVSFSANKGNALYLYSSDTSSPTLEVSNPTTTSVKGTAFFKNTGTGTEVSLGGGYPIYIAATKGKIYSTDGYLPFTGSHIVMVEKDTSVNVGDILCTDGVAYKEDVNNVFMKAKLSDSPKQKTRFGVYTGNVDFDSHIEIPYELWWDMVSNYNTCVVNGLGEGQINVCGEAGDIEAGDLIVTSSMSGKGMKGDDYTPVNRIVAQALEDVAFESKDQVKMIACVYLCS